MWGKLQTHGDKKNDAEVLAIAAAGAPLDVIAIVKAITGFSFLPAPAEENNDLIPLYSS